MFRLLSTVMFFSRAFHHARFQWAFSVFQETGLELLWIEDQPHAGGVDHLSESPIWVHRLGGFLLDMVANREVCARLQRFHQS